MILFTIIGIIVAALIAFTLLYFLYVEIEDRFLIRYCRKNLVVNKRCYRCGETNLKRLVFCIRDTDGHISDDWECFHPCDRDSV